MALTKEQMKQSFDEMVREIVKDGPMPLVKADIKKAITDADAWMIAKASSFNAALPTPFKNSVTASVKARLLAFVALRRVGK